MDKLDPRVAVPILLIADNDERRREELQRFFSGSGCTVQKTGNRRRKRV